MVHGPHCIVALTPSGPHVALPLRTVRHKRIVRHSAVGLPPGITPVLGEIPALCVCTHTGQPCLRVRISVRTQRRKRGVAVRLCMCVSSGRGTRCVPPLPSMRAMPPLPACSHSSITLPPSTTRRTPPRVLPPPRMHARTHKLHEGHTPIPACTRTHAYMHTHACDDTCTHTNTQTHTRGPKGVRAGPSPTRGGPSLTSVRAGPSHLSHTHTWEDRKVGGTQGVRCRPSPTSSSLDSPFMLSRLHMPPGHLPQARLQTAQPIHPGTMTPATGPITGPGNLPQAHSSWDMAL